ncbi:hypothetical protein KAR91_25955 [Candidatus Pacearchaeota archaeon]|nr:hypothetical protein [Candidatus Pacearchaeota archaeon]
MTAFTLDCKACTGYQQKESGYSVMFCEILNITRAVHTLESCEGFNLKGEAERETTCLDCHHSEEPRDKSMAFYCNKIRSDYATLTLCGFDYFTPKQEEKMNTLTKDGKTVEVAKDISLDAIEVASACDEGYFPLIAHCAKNKIMPNETIPVTQDDIDRMSDSDFKFFVDKGFFVVVEEETFKVGDWFENTDFPGSKYRLCGKRKGKQVAMTLMLKITETATEGIFYDGRISEVEDLNKITKSELSSIVGGYTFNRIPDPKISWED